MADKVDRAVMEVLRMIFANIAGCPEEEKIQQAYKSVVEASQQEQRRLSASLEKDQKQLELMRLEIPKAMMGESTFSPEDLSSVVSALRDKITATEKRLAEIKSEVAEKKAMSDGIIPAYRQFRTWASEFEEASIEAKKMIVNELFSRIELGLPYPSPGKASYNVKCPCCDEDPRGKHLNINLQKNVFRCPRCGVSGGIFALYSLYTGISVDKAREAIAERLSTYGYTPQRKYVQTQIPEVNEYPITDVETRNATYSALLSKLSLAPDHRTNLLNRGLRDEEIQRLGYKSTPVAGMGAIAKQLMNDGYYLAGVPGFYRSDNDQWTFIHENRGILIPMRDLKGNIQGLQIRRDNTEKRKFRWVSSAERKDGCKAEGWTHIVGAVKPSAILTEGPMKADVIHTLTGRTVIAVPGVNTLAHLKLALEKMREHGLTTVKTAFDMDMLTNPHVQNGYRSLLQLLDEMGFKFGTYLWDSRYKGLDDYIWEYLMNKER